METDSRHLVAVALGSFAVVGLLSLAIGIATRGDDSPVAAPTPDATATDAGTATARATDAGVAMPTAPPRARPDSGPYRLDPFPRSPELVTEGCPDVPLVDHPGSPVAWRPALRIHPAFVPSVQDVERAFTSAAVARYGRAPLALLSASSHRCRTMRDRPERLSEHALGNALDIRGIVIEFDGGQLEITVREHWGTGSIHDQFLHDAIRAVIEGARVRGVIGPPTADHLDHFHVDHGPSEFVAIQL